ncbi:MAG TPA: IclR family transcriptional regulator [Paenirhodobacter sp.]
MTVQDRSGTLRQEQTGTQSIRRTFAILRVLAGGAPDGDKLVEIAQAAGLSHPTAHRILKALEHEGVVERSRGSSRYRLAVEAAWLGVAPFNRCPITRFAGPSLDLLARETGACVVLSVPSHHDAVYVDLRAGPAGRAQTTGVAIGGRTPLGVTIGGRGMLAFLGEDRIHALLIANAERFRVWHCDEVRIRADIATARDQGWLAGDSPAVPGRTEIAMPVRDIVGRAIGAISLLSPPSGMDTARVSQVLPLLRTAAQTVREALHRQNRLS